MSSSDKKHDDVQTAIEKLRSQNKRTAMHENTGVYTAAGLKTSSRKRVSDGTNKVDSLERKAVMNDIIKKLLLGNMTQGEALKRLRIDVLGLQQMAYANLVSISRKTLSEIENNKGNYSVEVVNKAFRPFGLVVGLVPASKHLLKSLMAQ